MSKNYTTPQAAKALGLHVQTLYRAFQNKGHYKGIQPYKAINSHLLWNRAEVDALLYNHNKEQGVA